MDGGDGAGAGARARPRAAVRFTAALGRRICSRVAAGESQLAICAEAGMPSRATLWRWTRDMPKFAAELMVARSAGGVGRANARLPPRAFDRRHFAQTVILDAQRGRAQGRVQADQRQEVLQIRSMRSPRSQRLAL